MLIKKEAVIHVYHDTELWVLMQKVNDALRSSGTSLVFGDISPEDADYMEYKLHDKTESV